MITVEKTKVIKWRLLIELRSLGFSDFLKLFHQIKEINSQGQEVPTTMVREFFHSIEIDRSYAFSKENKDTLIENCFNYLSSQGYDFTIPDNNSEIPWPTEGEERYFRYYNLRQMITELVDDILNIPPVDWIRGKSDLVKSVYKIIISYNQDKLHNKLTDYATLVITGWILVNLGILDSYESYNKNHSFKKGKGYNKFLKDVVRNNLNAR